MGKIEKVVGLSVLFLMVVICVVTFYDGGAKDIQNDRIYKADGQGNRLRPSDEIKAGVMPEGRWRDLSAGTDAPRELGQDLGKNPAVQVPTKPELPQSHQAITRKQPSVESGLLQAGVLMNAAENEAVVPSTSQPEAARSVAPAPQPEPQSVGTKPNVTRKLDPRWNLKTLQGLEDTINPDYKLYTCATGDTYERLAKLYFGDARHAGFLRLNNEGVVDLVHGTQLWIPCINDAPLGVTYVVAPGDSLWTIAARQLGDGKRWKEIYEANRGTLRSPDDLRSGQKLILP